MILKISVTLGFDIKICLFRLRVHLLFKRSLRAPLMNHHFDLSLWSKESEFKPNERYCGIL